MTSIPGSPQDSAAAARQGIASPGTAGPTTTKPSPHLSFDGPALKFDFPGVRIGVAG